MAKHIDISFEKYISTTHGLLAIQDLLKNLLPGLMGLIDLQLAILA